MGFPGFLGYLTRGREGLTFLSGWDKLGQVRTKRRPLKVDFRCRESAQTHIAGRFFSTNFHGL
jgi:hypothetical protein